MQALGLIETRGLVAAIECADAMLKAAEVTLLEKTFVGGGLVTVAVTGDVGAVKAAVEAGGAAVRQLSSTLLISEHVIPRPHQELDDVIVSTKMLNPETKPAAVVKEKQSEPKQPAQPEPETAKESKVIAEKPIEKSAEENKDFEGDQGELHKEALDQIAKEKGLNEAIAVLGKLKVVKLRNLAREYKDFGIAGRMVSKADKQMIIAEFKKYYGQKKK
ncbi:MAG: BMC domain-containing protein [Clostridia bacterium]|nr:BMC domain-containing protein [Clostridia bacterium]